jgi:poly(glycerol-phosphate) alpha-glucosyltransferase
MTNALLHRSRAFVRFGGVGVDVLTFDARPDYPEVEERLRAAGEIVDGMRLLNLYDWLRVRPLPGGSLRLERHPLTPIAPGEEHARAERAGRVLSRTRLADDGVTVLQADHYRPDGTLVLSDRRDVRTRGVLGGRSVVLCDATGAPVRSWGRIWHLYRAWLDHLTGRRPSWLLVDSKTSANFMLDYRRRHVVTVHVVHGSHLASGDDPRGGLSAVRRAVFERLAAFDSVVVLSERQRREIVRRGARIRVVPNARPHHAAAPAVAERRGVVVLASLTSRKRVDHAVQATLAAGLDLDVYGEGDERTALERLAATAPGRVRLHGYRDDARMALTEASVVLLTSSSEGFPLVLVEAMGAGCVPVAYDVRYGPRDLIRRGTGFLVPPGDIGALTSTLRRVAHLDPTRLDRMRRRGRRVARRFDDARVTRRWARELRAARRRHIAMTILESRSFHTTRR